MIESSTSLKRKKFLALEFLTRQLAARNWVEQILGTSLGNESLNKALHDGVSLCRIVQKASPDSLPRLASFFW
ncbi:uncharacterized protein MONOS_3695 [Monocercomonoides exilis]|uniref:uncharacterized protein n=1 Tax=Monocercomonoides exilis TaxID=2049356 RepID=UPI00355966A9|nr:hypothetical protein MONOS_3695 [Monocercomonoides exilis]|eukprot:MONOS_3695.1-p1 / transcript=MONOS_3695.1 / gene=MONOS_3695 / organism=Monocercomonoides_exilis_PA203 / gene_product=unspecified product / transcript_product=unspecified product / location=Mono_scaffold00089:120911-121255(-) / protein_length=73 / sequence_SO=supercontig / SO=protein_coding / is_pseudo=false